MPTHAEKRVVPYTPEQMFDLVADVESYPQFLPWCLACRIRRRITPDKFLADLMIGFSVLREGFTSEVTLTRTERIDVVYHRGPFRYLTNHRQFDVAEHGRCLIRFYIDFEFRSRVLQRIMGKLFNEAVQRMVNAFERRAACLYGPAPARILGEGRPEIAASGEPPPQ
jgi:coenzyme Q-binding protein COQ10